MLAAPAGEGESPAPGAGPRELRRGARTLPGLAGVPTGTTPKDVVWTRNKTVLYRYRPLASRRHAVPVLLVYALINRPYVFDLRPDHSFVRHLLERGYDVFLLDWGRPGWEDRGRSLDELVGEHLPRAAQRVGWAAGREDYTLFGYCMGGTMAVMHAALEPSGVRNLVALTTPIDFTEAGTLGIWTDPRHLDPWAVAEALGNVPAELIELGTKLLRPVANLVAAPATMWERLTAGRDMTSWLAMHKWVHDGVAVPGTAFAQWIESLYQQNRLVAGRMRIGGRAVDLRRIDAALLAVAAGRDHLVPPAMARPLVELTASGDRQYHELPAGHVGLLAGSGARTGLWPLITDWLDERSD